MKLDPVCGTPISPEAAISTARYRGETYYFCSVKCKLAFDYNPQHYVKARLSEKRDGPVDRLGDSASPAHTEAH